MSDHDKTKKPDGSRERGADSPIEVYCPICGFQETLNELDESMESLSREEKISHIRELQSSDKPYFTCDGCGNPADSAKILEIR